MSNQAFPVYSDQLEIDSPKTSTLAADLIHDRRMKQRRVASKMRISEGYLSDLINGRRGWTHSTAERFARVLNGKNK